MVDGAAGDGAALGLGVGVLLYVAAAPARPALAPLQASTPGGVTDPTAVTGAVPDGGVQLGAAGPDRMQPLLVGRDEVAG